MVSTLVFQSFKAQTAISEFTTSGHHRGLEIFFPFGCSQNKIKNCTKFEPC